MRWLTSLFYGVNWCQFYPVLWILVYLHEDFNINNVDIKGFVRYRVSSFLVEKFSKR